MSLLDRYQESLKNIPPPGCGCHAYLLSVANHGIMAGLNTEAIFQDVRRSIPTGNRQIPDKEITDAISKALSDHKCGSFTPKATPTPVVQDGKAALQRIIDQGTITEDADLYDASPVKITWEPEEDTVNFLSILFDPGEYLFIGDKFGTTVKTSGEWIDGYKKGAKTSPHIIVNPLSGLCVPKKDRSGTTMRSDANVKTFKYCLVEFDALSREEQIRFWSAAKLPIVALIDSAKKSIHAWLAVQELARIETSEDWQREIKTRLYQGLLSPLGVDRSCANPARLSRLPGHKRDGIYQRLLWISREGRPVL